MRCAECGLYECCMRTPFGGCPNGEKAEPVENITTTNTNPSPPITWWTWREPDKAADSTKEPDEYMKKMRNALVSSWFGDNAELFSAAQDLVDAVERYTRQDCLRSELLNKKNALKKLLNDAKTKDTGDY